MKSENLAQSVIALAALRSTCTCRECVVCVHVYIHSSHSCTAHTHLSGRTPLSQAAVRAGRYSENLLHAAVCVLLGLFYCTVAS